MGSAKKEGFRCLKDLIDSGEGIGDISKIIETYGIYRRDQLTGKYGNKIEVSDDRKKAELEKVENALSDYYQFDFDAKNMSNAATETHDFFRQWEILNYRSWPKNIYIQYGYTEEDFETYKRKIGSNSGRLDTYELFKSQPQVTTVELSTSERQSLLKMIYGMAIQKYGYDPGSEKRSGVTGTGGKSIYSDLEQSDLTLDNQTIKKYLDEAVAEFGSKEK
jgi:hypothetical protein